MHAEKFRGILAESWYQTRHLQPPPAPSPLSTPLHFTRSFSSAFCRAFHATCYSAATDGRISPEPSTFISSKTKSSATAEKQRVSCTCLSLNTADIVQKLISRQRHNNDNDNDTYFTTMITRLFDEIEIFISLDASF